MDVLNVKVVTGLPNWVHVPTAHRLLHLALLAPIQILDLSVSNAKRVTFLISPISFVLLASFPAFNVQVLKLIAPSAPNPRQIFTTLMDQRLEIVNSAIKQIYLNTV